VEAEDPVSLPTRRWRLASPVASLRFSAGTLAHVYLPYTCLFEWELQCMRCAGLLFGVPATDERDELVLPGVLHHGDAAHVGREAGGAVGSCLRLGG
jgi:hypothetical protein